MGKVKAPWFVVDDPAATQFSLQSSVLQMQANTVYEEKKYKFKGRLINNLVFKTYLSILTSAFFTPNLFFQRTAPHLRSQKMRYQSKIGSISPIEDSRSPKSWRSCILWGLDNPMLTLHNPSQCNFPCQSCRSNTWFLHNYQCYKIDCFKVKILRYCKLPMANHCNKIPSFTWQLVHQAVRFDGCPYPTPK